MKRSPFPLLSLSIASVMIASCDSDPSTSTGESSPRDTSSLTASDTVGDSGSVIPWNYSVSYGSLTWAGRTYRTVRIGSQTWMAENLDYLVDGSRWYGNNADSGAKYGRLYTWASAMGLSESCDTSSCANRIRAMHQGVCPTGWHVPSDAEWSTLAANVGGDAVAASKIMARGWPNTSKVYTDPYGFRALPAGSNYDGVFYGVGQYAHFWSSSEHDAGHAWYSTMGTLSDGLERFSDYRKNSGYSVRCIEDSP